MVVSISADEVEYFLEDVRKIKSDQVNTKKRGRKRSVDTTMLLIFSDSAGSAREVPGAARGWRACCVSSVNGLSPLVFGNSKSSI
jgi:hypothetical protein